MSPEERFEYILGAEPFDNVPDGSRTRGYLLEFALRFGSQPFDCARIENQYVERSVVLDNFRVGEKLRNRTLTDRRVLGLCLSRWGIWSPTANTKHFS